MKARATSLQPLPIRYVPLLTWPFRGDLRRRLLTCRDCYLLVIWLHLVVQRLQLAFNAWASRLLSLPLLIAMRRRRV
jgi:hypothetical protein